MKYKLWKKLLNVKLIKCHQGYLARYSLVKRVYKIAMCVHAANHGCF